MISRSPCGVSTLLDLAPALDEFRRVGYARLGRVVSDETIAALGARVDDLMSARVRHEGMFFQRDSETGRYEDLTFGDGWQGPSTDYRKIEKLELDPLFRAFIGNPLHEQIARALIDGPIALYRAVLFTKSARGGTALPWHQDGGAFWGVDRAPFLQIWTALDDCVLDGGCLEVLPGSHTAGLATPQGGVIVDEALRAADAEARALPLPARAGESILIHNHLWHRSRVNSSGRRRSALSVCLMSAATRCLRKKRPPRQFVEIFR
ncbi:MAG: phytanoyl-CoA dioxygenase family protein [Polyangia bacterium]